MTGTMRCAGGLLAVGVLLLQPVLAESCRPITDHERGSPTGERIRATNAALLSAAGLTRILTSFRDPMKCWNIGVMSPNAKRFGLTAKDLCVMFDDFGVGSFDPLKHDYCMHQSYVLQLHDESAAAFRLYRYKGTGRRESIFELVGEFDRSGHKVAPTIRI